MQQLRGIDDPDHDNDSISGQDRVERRKTVYNLEKSMQRREQVTDLETAFERRNAKGSKNGKHKKTMQDETIRAFEKRKQTIVANRRKTIIQNLDANTDSVQLLDEPVTPNRNHNNHYMGHDNAMYISEI